MPHSGFPLFGDLDHHPATEMQSNNDNFLPSPGDAIRAWATAALFVAAIFAAVILYVRSSDQASTAFVRQLPPNYDTVVSALVRGTGKDCARLCSIAGGTAAGLLSVSCSNSEQAGSCANPVRYEIAVAGPGQPSR